MKRKPIVILLCIFVILSVGLSLVACNKINADLLGEPKRAVALSYEERLDGGFAAFKSIAERFSAKLASSAYKDFSEEGNFVLSPVSVFFALALASECASGDTRAELLSALGVSYEQLQTNFPLLYRSLFVEQKRGSKITDQLNLTNSIWVDRSASVKKECIDELADRYFTYSYAADFRNDNSKANDALRQFVKDKTNKLIDKDFKLSKDTLFAIVNTLYLKTIWNYRGDVLPFTSQEYAFTAGNGSVINKKLLEGEHHAGRVYETQEYRAFYTLTYGGFKIKFMLPNQGYGIDDVFTESNIAAVNAIADYNEFDEENNIRYATRCIFPEFKCAYDGNLKDVLKNAFGINKLFIDPTANADGCSLSSLTDAQCFCDRIDHAVNLDVNKNGIEGAAATLIIGDTSLQPADVKLDFVIDRAFGFIITDANDVTLFSGVVKTI